MTKKFAYGKILVHMANYGSPGYASRRKFWARSYGESMMKPGDVVTITIQHERPQETYGSVRNTNSQSWRVTEVVQTDAPWNEFITYFERVI